MKSPRVPVVLSIEIDGDSVSPTDTVGMAVSAVEAQPWLRLVGTRDLTPAASAEPVRLVAGRSTPGAPKGFWKTVKSSRCSFSTSR